MSLRIYIKLIVMDEVNPETLLEWLQMGHGEERDMQLIALENICMLLLTSDNIDRCFAWWDITFSFILIGIFLKFGNLAKYNR